MRKLSGRLTLNLSILNNLNQSVLFPSFCYMPKTYIRLSDISIMWREVTQIPKTVIKETGETTWNLSLFQFVFFRFTERSDIFFVTYFCKIFKICKSSWNSRVILGVHVDPWIPEKFKRNRFIYLLQNADHIFSSQCTALWTLTYYL